MPALRKDLQVMQPMPTVPRASAREDELNLFRLFSFLGASRGMMIGCTVAALLIAIAYLQLAAPVYESSILIQIQDPSTSEKSIPTDRPATTPFDVKTAAAPEIGILQSRALLSRAVDASGYHTHITPRYLPVIGGLLARWHPNLNAPFRFTGRSYVWGSQRASVPTFNVPPVLQKTEFILEIGEAGTVRLTHPQVGFIAEGKVGETIRRVTPYGNVEILVASVDALPQTQFLLTRHSRFDTVSTLQRHLRIWEQGRQSGLIGVALQDSDPVRASALLQELGKEYIRQNENRHSEEAQKSLSFLNNQLPKLRQDLERSEEELNRVRNQYKTVDLSEETKGMQQQLIYMQTKMIELRQKREEQLARLGPLAPAIQSLDRQSATLTADIKKIEKQLEARPDIEKELTRLTRDVKVNTEVYTSALAIAQQMRLAVASKVGSARLLDQSEIPPTPIAPKPLYVLAISLFLGAFVGMLGAMARYALFRKVGEAEDIEQALGMPVAVEVPHLEQPLVLDVMQCRRESLLLTQRPDVTAVTESIRRLTTSIQYNIAKAANNIILITGPARGVGKSFLSIQLAIIMGGSGKRILYIDADLRTGKLHHQFGFPRHTGLSDIAAGTAEIRDAIVKTALDGVDVIGPGTRRSDPGGLLGNRRLCEAIQSLSQSYDYVLIDTPPVLAVADALLLAPYAGITYTVARANVTSIRELQETVQRLHDAGAPVTGVVINDARSRAANNYQYKYVCIDEPGAANQETGIGKLIHE